MNYYKSIRKAAMAKRVIILLCIAIVLGVAVGGVSGYALKAHIASKNVENGQIHINGQADTEKLVYGAYDDRYFTEEVSLDWSVGDLDFNSLDCRMPEEHQEFVFYLCSAYNMDFTLVMALIQHESNFDSNAINNTNDYGYMQINIQNHAWLTRTLGITDYTDPYQNIRAGMFMLRKLFERYQETDMVLMAYSMGETGAGKLWKRGVFTTNYTQEVLTLQQQFNEQLESN